MCCSPPEVNQLKCNNVFCMPVCKLPFGVNKEKEMYDAGLAQDNYYFFRGEFRELIKQQHH